MNSPHKKIQDFHAPIGTVADTVVNLAAPLTEWEKQARFERVFKSECSKEAREWLEYLMEHRGFTCGELARAWRYGALRWDREAVEPKFNTPLLEAIVVWLFVGLVSALFLAWGGFMVLHESRSFGSTLWFYATGFAYLGAIYMACKFVLWPRKVAGRARRVWILDNDCLINPEAVS